MKTRAANALRAPSRFRVLPGKRWLGLLWIPLVVAHAFADQKQVFEQTIRPVLKEYCITCHSTEKQKGDLDLERFTSFDLVKRDPDVWEHSLDQIRDKEMPPKGKPRPSPEQMKQLTDWLQGTLDEVALASAGDPGPVVLRRLSNMEYTYTLRDLTGVESLDPAREFPVDGAAGEGFMNAGAALVMSPALLQKYLDAAKDVAAHMVLTSTGIRFSAGTSSRDATDETLAMIRRFYADFSDTTEQSIEVGGAGKVSYKGGRLPIARYLSATLEERAALSSGSKTVADVARARRLSAKYLGLLRTMLQGKDPSLLLDPLRAKWREGSLAAADIEAWQRALWRFANVGHLGKVGGPKSWLEPVTPLAAQHELRMKLQPPKDGGDLTLYLSTSDAGDGSDNDFAVWENARLITPGRGELPLRDVRSVLQQMTRHRDAVAESAVRCLGAADEAERVQGQPDVTALAAKHSVDAKVLAGWLSQLGLAGAGALKLEPLLAKKTESVQNYNFIKGWVGDNALSVLANSSDTTVRIPGEMKPHSIATHPSPQLASVIAWRSPVAGNLRINGSVQDGDTACGNGILYALELRRGQTREVLAAGESKGSAVIPMGPFERVPVMPGDVIALVIDPRAGNHACDHTPVNLTLSDGKTEWDLAKHVSPDILASNPHADRHGNSAVWHFLSQPVSGADAPAIVMGSQSLLSKWRQTKDASERARIAGQLQQLLQDNAAAAKASPADRELRNQLLSFNGPLLADAWRSLKAQPDAPASPYGLDPAMFGKHPKGGEVAATSLCVKAPSVIELRLPASLLAGTELAATARLHPASGGEASLQMQVLTTKPAAASGLRATDASSAAEAGAWNSSKPAVMFDAPILVHDGSEARRRFEKAFDDFRALFPAALCYTKIVPADEVVTLTLFHREDEQLRRLILDDEQTAELNRLWDELHFVSEDALTLVDAFEQIWQYSTQDGPNAPNGDKRLEPLREPIMQGAEAFKKRKIECEPQQVQAVLDFAPRAWRRPLTDREQNELRAIYDQLRKQDLPHTAAVRLMLARVLTSPAFLYRGEKPSPGPKAAPVSDWEIATRLSYFLWSSAPDAELTQLAVSGKLHDPDVLTAQARRMLKDERVRRLATEFGCQWLHVRDVATLDEKSERHFPTFLGVRADMQEEVTRFFTDLFQGNGSVLSLLDADHTFVNEALAKHYGFEVKAEWQRIDGLRAKGRGGILGFAATLAKQSGASRTSPILRGNWLSEVVLGEKLPRPPKGVPVLPDEAPQGLTERQLIEQHSSDEKCAGCHKRIDPFGFALEGFDAIGRARSKDAGGLAIDTRTSLTDGTSIAGFDGLRAYLVNTRRDDFLRQFSRKLLGYALGRSAQLSDKPLIENMTKSEAHRVADLVELIVRSPQFREVRGRHFIANN